MHVPFNRAEWKLQGKMFQTWSFKSWHFIWKTSRYIYEEKKWTLQKIQVFTSTIGYEIQLFWEWGNVGGITKFVLYTSGCNNSSHVNCNWCEWHRVRKKMFLHYAIPPHTMTERVGYRWLGDFKRRSGGIIFSWSQMHSNLWTYMTPHAVEKCVMSKIKRKTCFTIAFDFHFHTLPINPCLKTELIGPISDWYFS